MQQGVEMCFVTSFDGKDTSSTQNISRERKANIQSILKRKERGDKHINDDHSGSSRNNNYNSGTTCTTPGVMLNLPVLWLVVGLSHSVMHQFQ